MQWLLLASSLIWQQIFRFQFLDQNQFIVTFQFQTNYHLTIPLDLSLLTEIDLNRHVA